MNADRKISVLIVDDEERFRQGISNFLNSDGSLEVVGMAPNVARAIELTKKTEPDLILLDLGLPGSDGISALLDLKEMSYPGKVLVLSGHHEEEWIFRAMQAGAAGYVFKNRVLHQLGEAIDTVMRSEIYLPTEVASRFFRRFQAQADVSARACQEFHLTEREREVLYWLTQGAANDTIAQHLYVTVATVKAHLTSIFNKLQVDSRTQAIIAAVKLGLVDR